MLFHVVSSIPSVGSRSGVTKGELVTPKGVTGSGSKRGEFGSKRGEFGLNRVDFGVSTDGSVIKIVTKWRLESCK